MKTRVRRGRRWRLFPPADVEQDRAAAREDHVNGGNGRATSAQMGPGEPAVTTNRACEEPPSLVGS
jgi:hypothetical protein